jgi:hypothetical protein
LQDNQPSRIRDFLNRSDVWWEPGHLGLDRDTLTTVLLGLPTFVRQAGLPHSIIDEADLGRAAVERLLDAVMSHEPPAPSE